MYKPFESKIRTGFLTFSLLLVLLVVSSVFNSLRHSRLGEALSRSQTTLNVLRTFQSLTVDLETSTRGYVLSGDESYLEPYRQALAELPRERVLLRELASDVPSGPERLPVVEELLDQRIRLIEVTVETARTQGFAAARERILTGEGKRLMDRLRGELSALSAEEERQFRNRLRQVESADQVSIVLSGLLLLAAVFLLLAGYLLIRRHLADRAAFENSLRDSEARHRQIFESAPVAIWELDLKALAGKDLDRLGSVPPPSAPVRVLRANRSALQLFAVSDGEELGRVLLAGASESGVQAPIHKIHAAVLEGNTDITTEVPLTRADGRQLHALLKVNLPPGWPEDTRTLVAATDITEQREAREALRRSEETFHQLFENSPDAIVIVGLGGRIVQANSEAVKIFGHTREELLELTVEDLIPERFRRRHHGHREGFFSNPHRRSMGAGLELFGLRKDGSEFYVDILLSPLSEQGRLRVMAVVRDITERKQAEIRQQQMNNTLKLHAGQLEAVNKELEAFSYSVSHDLRAPLRHINGFSDLLAKSLDGNLNETAHRYLATIRGAANRMGTLIDDLLVFSRMGRVEMTRRSVALGPMVREVIAELRPDYEGRNVEWHVAEVLPEVFADPALMRQVLANLLGNALKYSRPRDPAVIEIGSERRPGSGVTFFVRDNGVGFDPSYAHKLFGVFQRLHRADEFEGTGIGLANVRRIVMRHGGTTWAEGQADAGATFFFSLPEQTTQETSWQN